MSTLVVSITPKKTDRLHPRERREHRVFQQLLLSVPGLEARLMDGSDEDVGHVAELVSVFF